MGNESHIFERQGKLAANYALYAGRQDFPFVPPSSSCAEAQEGLNYQCTGKSGCMTGRFHQKLWDVTVRWRGFSNFTKMESCQKKFPMLQGYLVLCRREQKRIHSSVYVAGILAMEIPVDFCHHTLMLKMYCDFFIVALHCKNQNEC